MKPKQFLEKIPTPSETIAQMLPEPLSSLVGHLPPAQIEAAVKEVAIDEIMTLLSAFSACNPDILASLRIDQAKKNCIRERLCAPHIYSESYPCEFTAYMLKECDDIDPSLRDRKTVKRHLDAEAELGELEKTKKGKTTIYKWPPNY